MCQNAEIEMNQTHRENFFFFFFLKEVPGTLHDGVSVDTGMSTNYQKVLRHGKIRELWGMGTE